MKIIFSIVVSFYLSFAQTQIDYSKPIIDQIGIEVKNNFRQFHFTNKTFGSYYGEITSPNNNYWNGWFINSQKVLHDYSLSVNGRTLDRLSSKTLVYPHYFERKYGNILTERFTFYDSLNIISIELISPKNIELVFTPKLPDKFNISSNQSVALFYESSDTNVNISNIKFFSNHAAANKNSLHFKLISNVPAQCFIVAAKDTSGISSLSKLIQLNHKNYFNERKERIEKIIQRGLVITNNTNLNKAFYWSLVSADALIMKQNYKGKLNSGIFAGLPWFNNYWGRDSFISLPGATYLFGNLNDAREIFLSFAKFQDSNLTSPTYGRIPNLITGNSTSYNTVDATPRFVIQLWEYFKISGDTNLVTQLFPVVRRSIEAALQKNVDALGFLTHEDAETWMDAQFLNKSHSPRGNRANDVQALWYFQLKSASEMALFVNEKQISETWDQFAKKVKTNFNNYFVNKNEFYIYDHLMPDNSPSLEIRPNQLFCLELVEDYIVKTKTLHKIIQTLVFKHGVFTLSQSDSNFHPFHINEEFYAKDDAYHNGIVWTWLNAVAINALCNSGGQEPAYELTQNMVHQILDRGCVGTLSELLDSHPINLGEEPKLAGTFSQAWSLSEFNRSLIQDYFGISIDVNNREVVVAPSLPAQLHSAVINLQIQNQTVIVSLMQVSADSIAVEVTNLPEGFRVLQKLRAVKKRTGWSFAKLEKHNYWKWAEESTFYKLSNNDVKKENNRAYPLFNISDLLFDDKGDSLNYTYPTNVSFTSGILDIINAKVTYDEENIFFNLKFRNLVNPGWHPEYGAQLTFAAIALETTGSGGQNVGYNSNYFFNDHFKFDRLIIVGGGLKVVDQKDSILCEYKPKPTDVSNSIGNVKKKEISFSIPKKFIGQPLNKWKMKILVGSQDDGGGAGIGAFRSVDSLQSQWHGGGRRLSSETNIYDILEN